MLISQLDVFDENGFCHNWFASFAKLLRAFSHTIKIRNSFNLKLNPIPFIADAASEPEASEQFRPECIAINRPECIAITDQNALHV